MFFRTRKLAREFSRKNPAKFKVVDEGTSAPRNRRWHVKVLFGA